jgi:hypothetical protein
MHNRSHYLPRYVFFVAAVALLFASGSSAETLFADGELSKYSRISAALYVTAADRYCPHSKVDAARLEKLLAAWDLFPEETEPGGPYGQFVVTFSHQMRVAFRDRRDEMCEAFVSEYGPNGSILKGLAIHR